MKRIFFFLTILSSLCADAQIVNRFRDSTQFYGSVRMDSIVRITKGAAAGKVLTSDANGTATWQQPASDSIIFYNGLTRSNDSVKLGGNIIENTSLSFDPTEYSVVFGDGFDYYFGFGNAFQSDGEVKLIAGVDLVDISTSVDTNNEYSQYFVGKEAGLFSTVIKHQTEGTGYDYGLAVLDKTQFGGTGKSANIYYGSNDGAGNTTDLIRIEVLATDEATSHAHMRRFINFTTPVNYNGVHVSKDYAQVEYNKVSEDDQATGTLWVMDANGASYYVGGTLIFRIGNTIPTYADDAAAAAGGVAVNQVYKTTTGGSTFLKIRQ